MSNNTEDKMSVRSLWEPPEPPITAGYDDYGRRAWKAGYRAGLALLAFAMPYEEEEVCLGCNQPTAGRDCGCPAGTGMRKKVAYAPDGVEEWKAALNLRSKIRDRK